MADPYLVLGVARTASDEEVRHAYRQLVLQYHPDVYQGDPKVGAERTRELNEARDILLDPARRSALDGENTSLPRDPPGSSGPPMWAPWTPTAPPGGTSAGTDPTPPRSPWDLRGGSTDDPYSDLVSPKPPLSERARQSRRAQRFFFVGLGVLALALVLLAVIPVPTTATLTVTQGTGLAPDGDCQVSRPLPSVSYVQVSWTGRPQLALPGNLPPEVEIYGPSGVFPVAWGNGWNGSTEFSSDGGTYLFGVAGCNLADGSLTFTVQYTAPLL